MSYVVEMRRKIHEYPEIGFDLPKTLELVRTELNKMGIPFTEKYGKSSIVATLNENKGNFTIGIRADMDALPVLEQNDVPYKSKIEGQMHACGHDAHTAMLLDAARQLSEMKEKIDCEVKFLFQPAEEYPPSGAKLMAEDGVMDDIDCIIALHVDPRFEAGTVNISAGPQSAISNGFHLDFYGRSSHAARQESGIDAIAMAVKAYTSIEFMIAKELPATCMRIFNVGAFHAGVANNVICPHANLFCTLRTCDSETDAFIEKRIKDIIEAVAKESGGSATFTRSKYYPVVDNNAVMVEKLLSSAKKVVGEEKLGETKRSLGGEDVSYFLNLKPGCMFKLGVKNEEKDCIYALHQDKFNVDEDTLQVGANVFVQFVLDNMHGIEELNK